MCGRFIISIEPVELEKEFGIREIPPDWQPHYNVAPTQSIPVVTDPEARQIEFMRWGLIPSWAKDATIGSRLINARAETISEKPSFRKAFQERRCLLLADGFFEWQRHEKQRGGSTPFVFRRKEKKPFAFAGLWEIWKQPDGDWLQTCTIITCEANDLVKPVHDRMPVMMDGKTAWGWLTGHSKNELESMLKPYPIDDMIAYEVSPKVNRPEPDSPDIIEPVQSY